MIHAGLSKLAGLPLVLVRYFYKCIELFSSIFLEKLAIIETSIHEPTFYDQIFNIIKYVLYVFIAFVVIMILSSLQDISRATRHEIAQTGTKYKYRPTTHIVLAPFFAILCACVEIGRFVHQTIGIPATIGLVYYGLVGWGNLKYAYVAFLIIYVLFAITVSKFSTFVNGNFQNLKTGHPYIPLIMGIFIYIVCNYYGLPARAISVLSIIKYVNFQIFLYDIASFMVTSSSIVSFVFMPLQYMFGIIHRTIGLNMPSCILDGYVAIIFGVSLFTNISAENIDIKNLVNEMQCVSDNVITWWEIPSDFDAYKATRDCISSPQLQNTLTLLYSILEKIKKYNSFVVATINACDIPEKYQKYWYAQFYQIGCTEFVQPASTEQHSSWFGLFQKKSMIPANYKKSLFEYTSIITIPI